jgi:hypothetical protein
MGVLPAAQITWGAQAAEFSTDVCDCCDNPAICVSQKIEILRRRALFAFAALTFPRFPLMQCKTLFCPCLTFSEIHQHVTGEG